MDIEFSKSTKIILYVTTGLIAVSLIVFSYWQQKIDKETTEKGIKMRVAILKITSGPSKFGNGSLWFKDNMNKVHHVNIPSTNHIRYEVKDSILVSYYGKYDWYILSSE